MSIEITMKQNKTTKGTVVYHAATEEGAEKIPALYIKKGAMVQPYPETITVKVEPA